MGSATSAVKNQEESRPLTLSELRSKFPALAEEQGVTLSELRSKFPALGEEQLQVLWRSLEEVDNHENCEATAQAKTYVVSRKAGIPVFASAKSYETIGRLQFGKEVVPTGGIIVDVDGDCCEMVPIHPRGVVELKHLSEKANYNATLLLGRTRNRDLGLKACPEMDNCATSAAKKRKETAQDNYTTSVVKNREATAQTKTYVVSCKAGLPVFASATSYETIGRLRFGMEVVQAGRTIVDVNGDGCEMLPIHPKGVVDLKHLSEKPKCNATLLNGKTITAI